MNRIQKKKIRELILASLAPREDIDFTLRRLDEIGACGFAKNQIMNHLKVTDRNQVFTLRQWLRHKETSDESHFNWLTSTVYDRREAHWKPFQLLIAQVCTELALAQAQVAGVPVKPGVARTLRARAKKATVDEIDNPVPESLDYRDDLHNLAYHNVRRLCWLRGNSYARVYVGDDEYEVIRGVLIALLAKKK